VDAVETLVLGNTSTMPSLPIVVVYAGETAGSTRAKRRGAATLSTYVTLSQRAYAISSRLG
jgi:hypothetical protein